MTSARAMLTFEMHFARDLLRTSTLDRLQEWLTGTSPRSAGSLEVSAYDRDPNRIPLDVTDPQALRLAVERRGLERGEVYERLAAADPPPDRERRFGSVQIRGRGRGSRSLELFVHFDSMTPAHPMGSA